MILPPLFQDLICPYFFLGTLQKNPQPIVAGLHHIWHIETCRGEFAIKLFSNAIRALQSHNLNLTQTQNIALQLQAQGSPAVVALLGVENHYVLNIDTHSIMAFPWITGVQKANLSLIQAAAMGRLLAQMHQVSLQTERFKAPLWGVYTPEEWQCLVDRLKQTQIREAQSLVGKLDWLIHLSMQARSAFKILNQHCVLSHRDLTPQNVLWRDNLTPAVLDWEYAGPINPQLERLIVAFNSSGILTGCFQDTLFREVLTAYDAASSLATQKYPEQILLDGYRGYVVDWIIFNCQRATIVSEQRLSALEEVRRSLWVLENVGVKA